MFYHSNRKVTKTLGLHLSKRRFHELFSGTWRCHKQSLTTLSKNSPGKVRAQHCASYDTHMSAVERNRSLKRGEDREKCAWKSGIQYFSSFPPRPTFSDRVSCGPRWAQNCKVTKDDLEILIFSNSGVISTLPCWTEELTGSLALSRPGKPSPCHISKGNAFPKWDIYWVMAKRTTLLIVLSLLEPVELYDDVFMIFTKNLQGFWKLSF